MQQASLKWLRKNYGFTGSRGLGFFGFFGFFGFIYFFFGWGGGVRV